MGVLPKEKQRPIEGWPDRAVTLLYGPPKAGKTTALATWRDGDILIIETEPGGARFVEGYVVEVSSLAQLRAVYQELVQAYKKGAAPWKAVGIDTIDMVAEWVEAEVAAKFGETQLGEAKVYGADFAMHRNEVLKIIRTFASLPVEIVLVAHSKPLEGEAGLKTMNLRGQLGRLVMALCDSVIYLEVTQDAEGLIQRQFVLSPAGYESGTRIPALSAAGRTEPSWEGLMKAIAEHNLKETEGKEEDKHELPLE